MWWPGTEQAQHGARGGGGILDRSGAVTYDRSLFLRTCRNIESENATEEMDDALLRQLIRCDAEKGDSLPLDTIKPVRLLEIQGRWSQEVPG